MHAQQKNRIRTALQLFKTMDKLGCTPNDVTCGCLMHHCFKRDKVDEAMKIMIFMRERNISTNEVMTSSLIRANNKQVKKEDEREDWQRVLDVYFQLAKEKTEQQY